MQINKNINQSNQTTQIKGIQKFKNSIQQYQTNNKEKDQNKQSHKAMQNQYYEQFGQNVQKAFQSYYPIFLMLPQQKRNQITNGLYELVQQNNRQKFKQYLSSIYFNSDSLVDRFITEITKQTKTKERTYEEFSRKAITTFEFIYPVFKVFEKHKQEDILAKLYTHAHKPNDDRIKEVLAGIYLTDESLQNQFIQEVYYEAVGNELDNGLYDAYATAEYMQEDELTNEESTNQEFIQWHEQLIQQIQQIGCQAILQSKIRVQQLIVIEKQCPQLERFSHQLEKQSSSNNIEQIKKLLNNYRYDEKILQHINKIEAPNTSNREKIYLWKKVREEIQILNIHQIYRSKEKIIEEEKQIKDKEGILIAGISGVGKTTFFLKMAGVKLRKIGEGKFNEEFQAEDPAIAKQFKISSRSVSCTKQPGVLIPKPQHTDAKKIVLIDTAGFEDSRSSEIDIINNLGTMKYIQQLRTLRIVIILSRNILGQRCSGLKRFGRLVANYFRNFRDVEQSISYVLTKNLTIGDLSQAVQLILKEIEAASNDSFGGYNYGFFFYHLKDQLDNQNVKEFHPNKCYVKEFLSMFILKKQALYNPAEYLNAAFSLQSLQKIKRKSYQLQKMIIETYKKREFSMTSYYMNLLQKLENLDERNNQIDILYKCHVYIQEQNGLLSKKYEVNLNRFFDTNAKELLETAEKIKEIAKQAEILKDPTQQRKYAYQIICEIAALKVDQIISSFSKKQQLQKQKHSSSSIVTYFKASLQFLKLQNPSLFEKICNMMDEDKQNITKKIKVLIQEKKIDEEQFRDAFQKYMDFFHYKDEESEDKREKRLKEIEKIFENALKDSQEEQTVVKIIQFGYEGAFQGQMASVRTYLQKLIVIQNQDFYLKQVVDPHFRRVVNQLKRLINEYTLLHKQNKIPFEPQKFKKIKLFEQNYDQIVEVMQLVQDSQIMNFHYKIGMAEYVKNIRNSLQYLIDSLNKQINQYYRDFNEINPRQIKKMFKDLKTHVEFLEEVHNQYKHVASIEDTVKDAERSVARFVSKIQKRANKQFIKGFDINIKLLVDLVMVEELALLQKLQTEKEKYEEIKIAILQKLLGPLYKMMSVVEDFQPIDNSNTVEGFTTGEGSHNSKFMNFALEPITIIDEYETQKLFKLLEYFRKLHQLLEELQDQRNLQFEVNISYIENEDLKQVILAFFKRKQEEYNSLYPIIMRNQEASGDPAKSKEMKRLFNYKLKENCIKYIKSYIAIQNICNQFQDIDVVEHFQRTKLAKINLKTKIQARLQKISRDFDLNQAENFTLKQLKDSFHEYLFLNQIHQDTKNPTKSKSFKEVQTKIQKFMKRHYSDWRTLFAYLERQLNENQLNIEFQELIHLFSKEAMKIEANEKQFYSFLQRIDKVINNKLSHINSNFVDCELEEKYEVIQKICQFKSTSTKINYTPTFKSEAFRAAYMNYFQELSEQFEKTKKKIQEGIFVSEKDQNKLFSSEIKIEMLLKDEYGKFLEEKYKQNKPLREAFEEYSKEIIEDLKTKYLGNDIKLDQKFSEFYRKTNKQNQDNIDKALLKMYQNFEKELVSLTKQDKNKYEAKLQEVSDMIQLMPQKKKNEFQKRLTQKNKQILKQEDEMITKANEFKQKKDIGKILNELDRATRMKHEEIIEKTVRIIRDYFEDEIKSIQPKNVTFLEEILGRNVSKLQSQKSWNEMKTIYPQLQEKHQQFQFSLQEKVVTEFISIVQKIESLPAKFLYENPVDGYTYHQLDRHPEAEELTKKLIELYNLLIKHEEFFAQRMEELNLSLSKLLENNKDNLQENINSLTDVISEFRKAKQVGEESYVKNIILGSINACLMKGLKEGIDKVGNLKKKKDLGQMIQLQLINQFYQRISSICNLMQQKMQTMMQFSIKKQLPNNPIQTITTILKSKQNQTRILNFNLKVFKMNKIPANWLDEVKTTYYNQYTEYEKHNEQIVEKSFQNVTIENEEEVREFLKIRAVLQENKFSFFPLSAKTKNISSLIQQRVEELKARVTEFYSGRNTKAQYEQMVKESERLRNEQLQKLNQIEEETQKEEKKIKEQIAEEMQRELKKVPHNDKRIENMEKVKKEIQTKKSSKLNDLSVKTKLQAQNIQKKYAKSLDPLDRKLIAFLEFNLINYMIIYRKNVSTYNFVDKIMNEHNFITNQLQNIKRVYGTLTIKKIYDILCNHDNQYGQMIKNEEKMFETYQKRIFKELTQTQDIHYLFKNIKEIADNPKTKNLLEERYNRYEKTYNECIHKYEKNGGTELARKDLIEQTLKLAAEIKQEYEKGVYSACNKEDLVAHIFAVWSIIKSCTNEDYQIEFVYQPHPAQILAIFLLLGLDAPKKTIQKVEKCMVQISTGEGKSVVLAGLSVFLALVGFDVYEACYSKYLSQRDYKEFEILFDTLNIKPKIKYNIFPEICRQVLNQSEEQTFNQKVYNILMSGGIAKNMESYFSNLISNNKKTSKSILIIDEADVFINREFLGEVYSPSINIVGETVNKLLDFIWSLRESSPHPDHVFQSAQFDELLKELPHFADVFKNQVHAMLRGLKNFKSDTYKVIDDKIWYKQGDGLSALIHHGYRTIFAYYHEHFVNQEISYESFRRMISMNLIIAHFSYSRLPTYFDSILGVTGTLQHISKGQKRLMEEEYGVKKTYIMPSIYGLNSKRVVEFEKVHSLKLYAAIVKNIEEVHRKKRPIIVFFKTKGEVNDFFDSKEFLPYKESACRVTHEDSAKQRDFRVETSTFQGKITIMTSDFSRGTDFKLNVKNINQHQGLHVIQAFMPESLCDYIQLIGRTGRQGKNGSVLIFTVDSEKQDDQKVTLTIKQGEQVIEKADNNKWNQEFEEIKNRILKANKSHEESIRLYTKSKTVEEVIKKIYQFNEEPLIRDLICKTILALDGTSSMQSVFNKVKDVIKQAFPRLYDTLKHRKINGSFEIMICVYRNYNSRPELLLEKTNFETKSTDLIEFLNKIRVDGGWGNQAIQVCFNHVNSLPEVDQIIIIGDAAANTKYQTKSRKSSKKINWEEKGYPDTNIEIETEELKRRKIEVHSYYLAAEKYFKKLSEETGGMAEFFEIRNPEAVQNFTNFISFRILSKLEELSGEAGDLVKYYEEKYVKKRYL